MQDPGTGRMQGRPLVRAQCGDTVLAIRRVPRGRFSVRLARAHTPGRARVFLALSARHLAGLLEGWFPEEVACEIASAAARAGL
jgi:hypothetical protein